ncbi:hypothetical protein GCM10008985_30430 [Halococcus dombrowskii]
MILASYVVFVATAIHATSALRIRNLHHTIRERLVGLPTLLFRYDPAILYPTAILWAIFLVSFVLNPSPSAVLRTGAFIILSVVTLFIIPNVVSRQQAFSAIAIVGAGCMFLALPAAFTGEPVRIGDILISGISGAPLELAGITLYEPTAIFDGQNYFRGLVAIGAVASAGVYAKTRHSWLIGICALNLIGVYLTHGRAARLATIVAVLLAAVYLIAGRKAVAGVTIMGILATIAGFAITVGVLPGPTSTLQSILGKRVDYWMTSYKTILARPVFGWGLVDIREAIGGRYAGFFTGVHNSYLRLFLVGGVVGGVTYLSLNAAALGVAYRRVSERAPLALTGFCLVVMSLFFQLFSDGTIFGTSLSSVLWALTIGYAQPGDSREQ